MVQIIKSQSQGEPNNPFYSVMLNCILIWVENDKILQRESGPPKEARVMCLQLPNGAEGGMKYLGKAVRVWWIRKGTL